MPKSGLSIDILGTSITISTDEEPEYLNTLLSKYRTAVESVQRVSGLDDPLKIAILTGFLLCDDLQQTGTSAGEKDSGEFERLTLGMISSLNALDQVLMATPDATRVSLLEKSLESPSRELPAVFLKLQNTVKNYEWGSPEWIPTLLGQANPSRIPWAELWMGAHPAGPSRVLSDGKDLPLPELIASDPVFFLGKETAETFGKLPFLFKILAAATPLSIQAHPNQEQAREGFQRENREGIPLDSPNRNYRDPRHKPEILCALSSFAALCGFRERSEIKNFISALLETTRSQGGEEYLRKGLESLVSALGSEAGTEEPASPAREGEISLKTFLAALFSLNAETRKALGAFIRSKQSVLEKHFPLFKDEWTLCSYFSGLYPGDYGIIAPLFLNIIILEPGQAIYLPAGVLHAYIHGMAVELMADSDNVLRGGLTSKRVDLDELSRIIAFREYKPEILKKTEPDLPWFSYPGSAAEFTLSVMRSSGAGIPYPEKRASIVLVTTGSATITKNGEKSGENGAPIMTLKTGESIFIPGGDKAAIVFSGDFTAYAATTASAPPGS